jgi:hypothetical protein
VGGRDDGVNSTSIKRWNRQPGWILHVIKDNTFILKLKI